MKTSPNGKIFTLLYDNSIDSLIPEIWARESLMILTENMVAASVLRRDFSNEIQQFGDVVNTDLPAEFTARRKIPSESVTIQDATTANVAIKLNQHFHTSFLIRDGEESKSFQDLVAKYLEPAVKSIARAIDQVVLAQANGLIGGSMFYEAGVGLTGVNYVGDVNGLTAATTRTALLQARKKLNDNKVPMDQRYAILTSQMETDLLSNGDIITADKIGDDGTALREASLGRLSGFNILMSVNAPVVTAGTKTYGALDAAEAAGQTVISVAAAGDETLGHFVTFAGSPGVHRVTAASTGVSITILPALPIALADTTVVTHYTQGLVNLVAGYAVGWHDYILFDGLAANTIEIGQIVTFGTGASGTEVYTVIGLNSAGTGVLLDRPLETAVANDVTINPGPNMGVGMAFRPGWGALVSRPLATPRAGTGALSSSVEMDGIGMRVTITYDGTKQGHLVTADLLCGIKVLDPDQAVAIIGAA